MIKQTKDCSECQECCEPAWKGYIRPFGFIATLGIFFILMFIDGNLGTFTVRDAYFGILETVLTTIVIAFYGSRGIEKAVKTMSNNQMERTDTISGKKSIP